MNKEMIETDVAIVGAGGGGAVLALALAKQNIRTVVVDQAVSPSKSLRGEIIQPNGQEVLDRLGVLSSLPADATLSVRHFHFCRAGGRRLCTFDYGDLPAPYNRAIVTLANVAHRAIIAAIQQQKSVTLHYGTSFTGLMLEDDRVVGLSTKGQDGPLTIRAKIVVGADGAFSKVREALKIPVDLHLYRDGYLIAALESDEQIVESFYYVGDKTILGLFPVTGKKVYILYMIPKDSLDAVKQQGIPALQQTWSRIAPSFTRLFQNLHDWRQVAYLPTGRVRTPRWVANGAVLIGDAAHAMNPHASQGRMQAMVDAIALSDLIPSCLTDKDYSAARLSAFERARRPQVNMLQHLADQQVFYWDTGNPVVAFIRDRVFQTLDRNARLRHQVLSTTAGLRTVAPFSGIDRMIAAGLFPDIRSHERSQ